MEKSVLGPVVVDRCVGGRCGQVYKWLLWTGV